MQFQEKTFVAPPSVRLNIVRSKWLPCNRSNPDPFKCTADAIVFRATPSLIRASEYLRALSMLLPPPKLSCIGCTLHKACKMGGDQALVNCPQLNIPPGSFFRLTRRCRTVSTHE